MTYASTALQDACREHKVRCQCLWEIKGPKNTEIAWISCYLVGTGLVIVHTYNEGHWNAFTPAATSDPDATIIDIFNRCDVKTRLNP